MTLGVRQVISSIRNGRGGHRGSRDRGGVLSGISGRASVNVASSGAEIDYDEK